jgi:hypothetical protein
MQTQSLRADPFALLLNPQDVVAAMQGSERLHGLARRVCRPLDRPLIPHRNRKDVAEFDNAIDAEPEAEVDDEFVDDAADLSDAH